MQKSAANRALQTLASESTGNVVTGASSGSKGVTGGGGTDDINSNKPESYCSGEGGGGGIGNDSLSSSWSSIRTVEQLPRNLIDEYINLRILIGSD